MGENGGGGFAMVSGSAVPFGCFLLPHIPSLRAAAADSRLRMELGKNFKSTFVATENVFSFPLISFFLLHWCSQSKVNCLYLERLQKCLSYSSV